MKPPIFPTFFPKLPTQPNPITPLIIIEYQLELISFQIWIYLFIYFGI